MTISDDQIGEPRRLSEEEVGDIVLRSDVAMVLTNPNLDDNPIVYVNSAFEAMTGFTANMAIGRNCRFLQGDDREQPPVDRLRDAIASRQDVIVDLMNYRSDGSQFKNRLRVSPVFAEDGKVEFFLGLQNDVSKGSAIATFDDLDEQLAEIQHRVKNHLSMVVALIRQEGRSSGASGDFSALSRRIESLQLLYEEMMNTTSDGTIAIGPYLGRVANTIAHLDGRAGIKVNVDFDAGEVPLDTATQVGLILSELMTNTLQHAFRDRQAGTMEVSSSVLQNGGMRLIVADDGVGFGDEEWPNNESNGGRIVDGLVKGLDAELNVSSSDYGAVITIDIPVEKVQSK
ncbi:PAS domain-containing protein [Aestuariibius insulae]|uniref:PAS domain-containing protein n=1 Tax=Aestuariibius insulae TaxID=2058287 RepID=UPI00345E533C